MKITDLYEKTQSEQFDDELHKSLTDVLVMFKTKNIDKTHINNIINELSSMNFSVSKNDLIKEIDAMDEFEIDEEGYVAVVDEDQQTDGEGSFDEEPVDELDQETQEGGYDRVENIAKDAVDDDLK